MNNIFDFQRLLQKTYNKLERASQKRYIQDDEGRSFDIPVSMINSVVSSATNLGSLVAEYGEESFEVLKVKRTLEGELEFVGDDTVLTMMPSGMYGFWATDPRWSHLEIFDKDCPNQVVKCYPAQSAVAHAELNESGYSTSEEMEWRLAIAERIESEVLGALATHYEFGMVSIPEFSNAEFVEYTHGQDIALSRQLTVDFDVFRSQGMKTKNLAKTIADFFWHKLALPGQVYTSPSVDREVKVSVLVEVPE